MQTIPDLSTGSVNLRNICWLRSLLVLSEIVALAGAKFVLQLRFPETELLLVLLFYASFIVFTFGRLKFIASPVRSMEFFIQLLVDLAAQSVLLYFTGGYTNPLVSAYLVIITTGAALLPGKFSWGLTISAVFAYTLLMNWYHPLEVSPPGESGHDYPQMVSLHLLGMWFTFVISALLINYFVVNMASALRKQHDAIARHREQQLRHEHILAIAIQAAGAAHELGTPLATMNIVLDDLLEDYDQDKELTSDLQLLKNQITECKKRLNHLVEQSLHTCPETIPANQLIDEVLNQWLLIRPDVPMHYQEPVWAKALSLRSDPSLVQAIISLLNNAADACSAKVSLKLTRTKSCITICIDDDGAGLQSSGKKNGLGIGLLLSQASIEQMDGKVRLFELKDKGTRTEVTFPIEAEPCQQT